MGKRIGRYNVEIQGKILKFNVYINDYGNRFIYFEGDYVIIVKKKSYKSGWLWQLEEDKDYCDSPYGDNNLPYG